MCRGILGDVAMRRRSVVQKFIGILVFPVQTEEKKKSLSQRPSPVSTLISIAVNLQD